MKKNVVFAMAALVIVAISTTAFKTETLTSPIESAFKNQPVAVSLSISAFFNGPGTTAGTFSSSGFLNTTGTTSETVRLTSQTFHGKTVFTDANGSFTAILNGQYALNSPTTALGSGNWNIISGTGAYAMLKGNGQMSFTVDFVTGAVNDEWTGSMLNN